MKSIGLHLLFFCSGLSGLIYQVVWVRQFGHVFGNTVYSASIVVAIVMLGLGAGSVLFGRWADLRYALGGSMIRAYAVIEAGIAALGVLIALVLPHLSTVVSELSSYAVDSTGWHALTAGSYAWRGVLAVALLGPIALLMGGTLTVLIRALVGDELRWSGWRVGLLYGANTLGAAAGALLTDFALVPTIGLLATQCVAAGLNAAAAAGAYAIGDVRRVTTAVAGHPSAMATRAKTATPAPAPRSNTPLDAAPDRARYVPVALALACSGFAALGLEILWLRHLTVLLGGFRAVFALLVSVMLLALGVGALAGGWVDRRVGRPTLSLMYVEALFVITSMFGIASADADTIATRGAAVASTLRGLSPSSQAFVELLFNLRPMVIEVAVPSLIAGLAFPLANAIVQRVESTVGWRAGILYAANTLGAVFGSLITGYVLLPRFGMQGSAAVLAAVALSAVLPLAMLDLRRHARRTLMHAAGVVIAGMVALFVWFRLPADFVVTHAVGRDNANGHVLTMREGVTELVAVVEKAGQGRGLLTNGHAMSSTALLDQRYMRALAHIPLLAMNDPRRVLVIGFGVGNTTHAATLHESVRVVEVADLSRQILGHASYFEEANRGVLRSPKVSVFVNDGRQHLEMAPRDTYDLITLEPPPIAHAGVAALYSREFYELARSRLTPGGYVSQWLPAYQVPADSSLAMVRAFVDVFPQSVLLSGTQAELILLGTTAPRIELDPGRVVAKLAAEPSVREDLTRVDLASLREIAGTFVAGAETLTRATSGSPAVIDDRPLQEYGVRSGLTAGLQGVPSSLFDVTHVDAWCPRCVVPPESTTSAANLDLYLRLLQQAYVTPTRGSPRAPFGSRRLLGSAYLGTVVPDTAEVHNLLGLAQMREGHVADAVREFEQALTQDPATPNARANLGQIRYDQGAELLDARQYSEAASLLRSAVDLLPDSAEAQNDLGVALASMGRVDEARGYFRRAVALQPEFAEARRNLESADQSFGRPAR